MLSADLIKGMASFGIESLKAGASTESMKKSFDALRNSTLNHNTTITSLREAVGGLVNDVDLMTSANQYMNLGLPTGGMEEMYAAAIKLGRAMGMEATQSIGDFNTAVGRASPLILDNFGITLQAADAQRIYAEQIGKTANELTEAEKKTAFQTVAIQMLMEKAESLGDNTSAMGDAWTQFGVTVDNLKASIGTALLPVLSDVLTAFSAIMPVVTGLIDNIKAGEWDEIKETMMNAFSVAIDAVKGILGEIDWGELFKTLGEYLGDIPFMAARALFNLGGELGKVIKETDWNTVFEGMWEGWSNFIGSFVKRVAENLWEILPASLRLFLGGGTPGDKTGGNQAMTGIVVPGLADGAIVTKPTLALIGERGTEAVIPLDGGNAGFGGGTTHIILEKIADTINLDPQGMNLDELTDQLLSRIGDRMLLGNVNMRRV